MTKRLVGAVGTSSAACPRRGGRVFASTAPAASMRHPVTSRPSRPPSRRRKKTLAKWWGVLFILPLPPLYLAATTSHVLGRAARVVGDDFERLHGYRPWLLETFVDQTEHTGASVRAANWVRVGETCGRGRRGPHARGARNAQGGVCVRVGTGVARTPRGARTGHCAAGGGRRARRRVLGGPRVWRGAAGRCAPERTPGPEWA